MFLVALLQCNFLNSLAGSRWRLKIRLGWSFCGRAVHYQLIILSPEALGGVYPSSNSPTGIFINTSRCVSEPSCVTYRMHCRNQWVVACFSQWRSIKLITVKLWQGTRLSLTEGPCSPEAMEQGPAWPCTTWLEAWWSWSFLLQTGCCFPNRPPKAPKYCSTDHKLKWVLIHLSGLMAGSSHSRTLCCRDLNSFGSCGFAVWSKPN